MKFAYQVGLALLVNGAIVAGEMLPGRAIISVAVNSEKKEEPRVLIAEVILEGVPDNLKEVVLKAIVTKAGAITNRSQLQKDINSIFETGWFKEINATPSDTPKGVRVTFKAVLNPVLRQVDVKPKNQRLSIPRSIIDEIFGSQYGKVLNSIALRDGMNKLLRWSNRQDSDSTFFAQVEILKDVSIDGLITLGFSDPKVNVTSKVRVPRSTFIEFGRILEESGKLDEALISYQKAAVLVPDESQVGMVLQSDPFDNSPQQDRATAYKMISKILRKKNQIPAAEMAYRQALSIESDLQQAHRDFDEGEQLFQKGDASALRQAIDYFQQTLKLSQQNHIKLLEALALDRLGRIYDALGEKEKALEFYNQTSPIARAIAGDPDDISTLTLDEKRQALAAANKALLSWRAQNIEFGEAQELQKIATIYQALSENQKALDFYSQALQIRRALGHTLPAASILNNMGDLYYEVGEKKKALDIYNQSLSLYRAIGTNARSQQGTLLNSIANIYFSLGDKENTFKLYEQSLSMSRETNNRLGEASTLTNMGAAYSVLGQKKKALDFYNQSLRIRRSMANRLSEASTLNNLGAVHSDLGDYQKALEVFNQALLIYRSTGDRSGEAKTLGNLATVYMTQNKLTDALQNINATIEIIESVRSELKDDALRTSYFASVQSYYQLKTDILMQLHQQQPTQGYDATALENTDQSRARVLRELLIQANANISKDVSPDLLKQEQTLNQTLNNQEKQLVQFSSQSGKEAQLATLKQSIAALYTDRDTLKNTIRRNNPAYANLQYPKPITLAQIQQQLEPDTLMLQYSLGEKQSYLWVISNTTLKTYRLPKRSDIETTAKLFRQELTGQVDTFDRASIEITPVPSRNPSNPPLSPSNALTQQILAPAAADLGQKRLVIIPDGILNTIPFSALNTPNSNTYTPLLTQHEITNLPSASTIAILRTTVATQPRAPKLLAILADPIFNKNDPRLTGKALQSNPDFDLSEQSARQRNGRDLNLTRLPFTATEAKGILNFVPQENDRTSAFGFDASYDWITSPKISQYRYVHLATHGIFDNSNPALSSIILSSFDAQGRDRKAYLRFPDLFNLNLPTELVVLSACQTGLGNDIPGEGLVGMTRGLMYAGALRVSVSLWNVDDQTTSDLMQQFYKNLWQSKMSHAASLRQAQLSLWKQGKAPVYWAAFTLQGEWRN